MPDLKKHFRAFRRDYFDTTGIGALLGAVSFASACFVGAMMLFGPTSPIAMPLLIGALLASSACIGGSALAGWAEAKKCEDAWVDNAHGSAIHIVGPGLKVKTLVNTQEMVTKLTRDLSRSTTLPAEALEKMAPWLRDAEEAAKEVQGWDSNGNPALTVGYMRDSFNAQGKKVKTPVASFSLFDPGTAAQPAPAAAAAPAPSGVIVVPKTITLKGQTP